MKVFFFKATIFTLHPFKVKCINHIYDKLHKLLHLQRVNTPAQLIFSNPSALTHVDGDPRLKAMLYVALKQFLKNKAVPDYTSRMTSSNETLALIVALINGEPDAISRFADEDFLGHTLFTFDSEVLDFYRTAVLNGDRLPSSNPFSDHAEFVEAVDSEIQKSHHLANVQLRLHKSFCLEKIQADAVDRFRAEYQKMLDLIFADNPCEECSIASDEHWEVKIYNELVKYLKGAKEIDKGLFSHKAITLNQRGIRQYVLRKSKQFGGMV